MSNELGNSASGTQRTRRNIMKMGAILVPAALGKVQLAVAQPPGPPPPPGGGPPPPPGGGNCFLKGTKIGTAEGERKIEDLAIGDLLPTMFGGLRPIQWIGRYPFKKSDPSKPWMKDALPVRIARFALAPNVPNADLYVTPLHSVFIDGVLVPAELLINGATITRYEPQGAELEFFHIKLESHDVVYAEGAPAETLLKVEESAVNFAEYFRQYGTPATDENRCAPYVDILGGREELKSRFRSALSPWIDLRNQAEVIRDRLEEGGFISSWQSEPA
jgi:Hint domain